MSIVFLGDVSIPPGLVPTLTGDFPSFSSPAIANLEGPILDIAHSATGVWNSPAVLEFLARCHVRAVTLANNHITDLGVDPADTARRLATAGISAFGAGANIADASAPQWIRSGSTDIALVGFGWEVIGCKPATDARAGVNPLRPQHVLDSIRKIRSAHPQARVAAMMHWDYEGEIYPQPMHRQLAFATIEAGADAVIGCHPHCVQGIEIYQGAPIVYSLGNWFLPWGQFWGGNLVYPSFMRRQLAFEWTPDTGTMACHWYDYEPKCHSLRLVDCEAVAGSDEVRRLTRFDGMTHEEYRAWFRRHRRKRRWLPVYDDMASTKTNLARDYFVSGRQRVIDAMVRLRLKGGPH